MKLSTKIALGAGTVALAMFGADIVAFAQTATATATATALPVPVPVKGDTTWMLISSVLVLMMCVPGLPLFYGGLVRTKNMASVLSQCLAITCMIGIVWTIYGYSMAFTGSNAFIGGFSKAFLAGVTPDATVPTFSHGVVIPELVFVFFQGTFACLTPALIIGSIVERVKFSAVLLFMLLWTTFVYFPIAHMVWYGGGGTPADPAGLAFAWGALDFAGGTVVHINAGIAALVGCLLVGKRVGFGREAMTPHSLTMTMIGAALLWVGWFGFNAGSNLEANGVTTLAAYNTFIATCAAAISWMFVEWTGKGKPSLLGLVTGAVAGLVAVTPAAGFAGPIGALVLGLIVSPICFYFCTTVKNALGYDDSLDVFGVHCIGGIVGAIGTGIVVDPNLGGVGVDGYTMAGQVIIQIKAVLLTLVWSGVGALILFKVVDLLIGLRVTTDDEREGLDIASHGESAYHP